MTTDPIKKILVRAAGVHAAVNQFYGNAKPYSYHLEAVLNNAMEYGNDIPNFDQFKLVIAFGACFHDAIEDTRLTYNDVLKIAGEFFSYNADRVMATEIVYALTNEKGRTRIDRENDKYFEELRKTPFAPFVKFCDRLANFTYATETNSSLRKKYYQEMPAFIERLKPESDNHMLMIPERLQEAIKKLMKRYEAENY